MKLLLNDYNLSKTEWCQSFCTLSGLPIATRHWTASHDAPTSVAKWGHRIIAVLEACPVLGAIVAAIELIIAKCLMNNPPSTPIIPSPPPPVKWDGASPLTFDKPFLLTVDQLKQIQMQSNMRFSQLPEYADSIFRSSWKGSLAKIVRIKNEASIDGRPIQLSAVNKPVNTHESIRVRTYCLELLSNLEDRLIAEPNTKKSEEIIQCIKYYLENIAFKKEAGFINYSELLSALLKEAPEYESIFKRHQTLVDLQKSLPKPVPPKSSHWDKIKTVFCSGLLTPQLSENALKAIQHGLRPLPPMPKRQRVFKLYPMLDTINLLSKDYREAGRWLMHQIRLITFRELCDSIKKSCESLSKEIADWNDYAIFSITGKSQAWMADIAYRYLPIDKLTGVLTIPQRTMGPAIYQHISQSPSNNFLLFDDGAYTGQQLLQYLGYFAESLKDKEPFANTKNLYLIYGHFPKSQYERISTSMDRFKKYNVNIKIITHNWITGWENAKLDDMKERASKLSSQEKMTVVTEWKRPDFVSTSMFITEGDLHLLGKADLGELSIENISTESLHGEGPIAKIATPYVSQAH